MKYITKLKDFFEYLDKECKKELTMGIGISVINNMDITRNLNFDIKLSNYDYEKTELVKYLKNNNIYEKDMIIFDYDFNNICMLNKVAITKFNKINKIKKIVFDSSTFKFLNNIKFIGMLYYLTLEMDGEIYIESNNVFSVGYILNKISDLYYYTELNKNGFKYQTAYLINDTFLDNMPVDKIDEIKKHIYNKEDIYKHNLDFLNKWFYGSKVELIEDDDYPISNNNYPVKKYYKITKLKEHTEILSYIADDIDKYNEGLGQISISFIKK